MLRLFSSSRELNISSLMDLHYAGFLDADDKLLKAEQNFYSYVLDFMKQEDSFYAVWEIDGRYACALRIEPYQDGYLIEGLVTDVKLRNNGYAKALLAAVCSFLFSKGCFTVYSHIRKDNAASIGTHKACGFCLLYDYAHYIDNSVDSQSYTFVYKNN